MNIRKIMLLGEIGVGKTSIARRLAFQVFDESYKATIGTDIYQYDMSLSPGGDPFRFLVWDTDGSFGDAMLRHVYIKEAHAAMIVADVARQQTIETMATLGEKFADALPGRFCGFVLNKSDLLVPGYEPPIPAKLRTMGAHIASSSARTGTGIAEAFERAARAILRRGL